jgi:2-oxoglutarate dehydrogenase E1 component
MNSASTSPDQSETQASPPLPHSLSLGFVEAMYADFQSDPQSVPEEWRQYFAQVEAPASTSSCASNGHSNGNGHANGHANGNGHSNGGPRPGEGPRFKRASIFNPPRPQVLEGGVASTQISPRLQAQMDDASSSRMEAKALQERVSRLVRAHRVRGHLVAHLDPLDLPRPYPEELDPEYYGFTPEHMAREFSYEIRHSDIYMPESTGITREMTLHQIVEHMRNTYCRSIGAQFMHIDDLDVREWLQERMESTQNRLELDRKQQIRILSRLTDAVAFEEFIRRKFVGAKSFSLEGAESLVPLLDLAIEEAGEQGIGEIVMGMAHRGRLNVLANIIGKSPREIFREFEDKDPDLHLYGGDVKYHLGYVNDFETSAGRKVHLSLCFNPSHLEFVNPVAQGRCRAKQDRMGDFERQRGMVILIHGDAAFAGEGVVQETLNMSQLKGYRTGGTLHIIVNNQIGFTTGPEESRSSTYCTDVAKMLQIPIFHVNGEDPEAVAQVVKLAMEFRHAFGRDVVIDMYCYRRLGHNETDEASFTQPRLYRAIQARKPVREAYLERLLDMKGVSREEADAIAERRREQLEKELSEARSANYSPPDHMRKTWGGYFGGLEVNADECDTGVPREKLSELLLAQTRVPEGFNVHRQLQRFIDARKAMATGEAPLNWSAAEALALASLSVEGVPIRLSGQDSERGTFTHRHGVWHDTETDEKYTPLHHVAQKQARIELVNSPLSEIGPLGLEYGYSLDTLDGLVIWEAQFGDFWNCAQVIVDQFISSAEDKWHHLSGLVMLLPHGMEGMGPEHSSARLERFLSLAAEDNIQIVYPTTPAQYFHLLRRQVVRQWRKPLVVMSPKSLLRHLECVSDLDEMATGKFQKVIPETKAIDPAQVTRVLLCTGKIYYELSKKRDDLERDDVAIVRMEQLYPFPKKELREALAPYREQAPVVWVQEEPMNMGAWRFMRITLGQKAFGKHAFWGVYRPGSASPATGSSSAHKKEQDIILQQAFDAKKKK